MSVVDLVATDVVADDELDLQSEVIFEHEIPSALGLPGTTAVRKAAHVLAEHYGGRPTWYDVQQDAPLMRIAARTELPGDLTFVLELKQRDPDYVSRFLSPHALTQAIGRATLAQVRARARRDKAIDPQIHERLSAAVDPERTERALAAARRQIAAVLRPHGKLEPAQFASHAATQTRPRGKRRAGRSSSSARAPDPDGSDPPELVGPLRTEGGR